MASEEAASERPDVPEFEHVSPAGVNPEFEQFELSFELTASDLALVREQTDADARKIHAGLVRDARLLRDAGGPDWFDWLSWLSRYL